MPLAEFLDHEGNPVVREGDEVDVYFEGTETENGTVTLSHAKAEKFKVWRELERAFQNEVPVEGVILGKVKGGLQVDIGVPAFLPGSHVDIRPAATWTATSASVGASSCSSSTVRAATWWFRAAP